MTAPDLGYQVSEHIAVITLNRPARRNAFTLDMLAAWARALRTAEDDDAVRAVIVTGAGGAFCSGVDLDVFTGRERTPLSERALLTEHVHPVAHAAADLTKPYLAAVGGPAVGAGMDMALMCDIRLAGESATFCEGYVRVGLVPGDGGCYYLPRIVGMATALRLLWTAETVTAAAALRLGLVSSVHADDAVVPAALELAARLAAMPPIAVRLIKRASYAAQDQDVRGALDAIASHQAVVTSTSDSREAMASFREHRPPIFTGR